MPAGVPIDGRERDRAEPELDDPASGAARHRWRRPSCGSPGPAATGSAPGATGSPASTRSPSPTRRRGPRPTSPTRPTPARRAKAITAGAWVRERASGEGDEDWFTVALPGRRRVVVTLGDLPVNARLELYGSCSTLLASTDQAGNHFERLTRSLPGGTYRVRVRVPSGARSLSPFALRVLVVDDRVAIESATVKRTGGTVRVAGRGGQRHRCRGRPGRRHGDVQGRPGPGRRDAPRGDVREPARRTARRRRSCSRAPCRRIVTVSYRLEAGRRRARPARCPSGPSASSRAPAAP